MRGLNHRFFLDGHHNIFKIIFPKFCFVTQISKKENDYDNTILN
jgi:hypothetical protein